MNKMKRELHPLHYQESERRIITHVLEHVHKTEEHHSFRIRKPVYILGSLFSVLLIVAILVFNSISPNTNIIHTPTLNDFQNRKLAEIGYLSGSIIASSQSITTANIFRLSDSSTPAYETNIDTINLYFDMLRVFLEDDPFSSGIVVEDSDNPDYDSIITFSSNGYTYQFQLKYTDTNTITGLLLFETREFIVEGTIIDGDNSFEINLEAIAANEDFVRINYETESEDEIETEYFITSSLNGEEITREIIIEHENNESKVQIIENNNEFHLEKEFENGEIVYELAYHIDDIEGSAKITEQIDASGNISYYYIFEEGDHESEFEHDRPDYDDEYENDQSTIPYIVPTKKYL